MKKIVVGIDPGTRFSGYAVLHPLSDREFSIEDLGVIKAPNKESLSERLLASTEALEALLDHFSPLEMAIESQFVYKNAKSALLLSSFAGAFTLVAKKRGIKIFCYAPAIVKKALTGNGQATKAHVQKMAQIQCKIDVSKIKSDATDALALAIAHLHVPESLRKEY